jgi:hypothetical protein
MPKRALVLSPGREAAAVAWAAVGVGSDGSARAALAEGEAAGAFVVVGGGVAGASLSAEGWSMAVAQALRDYSEHRA